MADKTKFEQMLELLVNEERDAANELFHEIVVEKSREIYENILAAEANDEDVDEANDEEVDEADDEDVDESDEDLDEADDEDVDESDEELEEDFDLDEFDVSSDQTDNMLGDLGAGPGDEGDEDPFGAGDDMDGEGDIEDRVVDLEDALDELRAEFDKMMGGSDDDDDMDDMDGEEEPDGDDFGDSDDDGGDADDEANPEKEGFNFGMGEGSDEDVDESDDEEVDETRKHPMSAAEQMREYVDRVAKGGGLDVSNSHKSEASGTNTKSPVGPGENMGGTSKNLNQGKTENGTMANKGALKGSALSDQSEKEDNLGNVNVPGGKASKSNKPMPKGHGAEKKGSGDTAANKKSLIGSR